MPVIISLLRAVNLGRNNQIRMDALRALYASLKLENPQTYVQSGNVVFKTKETDLAKLTSRLEAGIEKTFGFRAPVILRTLQEMRDVVANNPFAGRSDIEPGKLLVTFMAGDLTADTKAQILEIKTDPEELRIGGRELYIYFPNGAGRSKLPWARLDKVAKTTGTARNWNTVTKLLAMAEKT